MMSEARIKNRLVKHGQAHMQERRRYTEFTGVSDYDDLLNNLEDYPHAFVIACVMDRQIKAEKAWSIPTVLGERIGSFEFDALQELTQSQVRGYFTKPTPLHRYTEKMVECLYSAIHVIGDKYNGDASRIWTGKPSSSEVVYRFLEIHGIGPKIATMATNILVRSFKIKLSDYFSVDVSADVHVKRVFHRLGLTGNDATIEQVIYKARSFYPEFPGMLDYPCWEIGRNWCRPRNRVCSECYMNDICPSNNSE